MRKLLFIIAAMFCCLDSMIGVEGAGLPDFGADQFTFSAWVKTKHDGSIFSQCMPDGAWVPDGKALFIRDGTVNYDIGWVGCVSGSKRLCDGQWHHVVLVGSSPQEIYIDARKDAAGSLAGCPDPAGSVFKIGYTSANFPSGNNGFNGALDEIRIYNRRLSEDDVWDLYRTASVKDGLVAHWSFEDGLVDVHGGAAALIRGKNGLVDGRLGKALQMENPTASLSGKPQEKGKSAFDVAHLLSPAELDAKKILRKDKAVDFDKIVFVRRLTYSANHYYTEYINSLWTPGGNISVLDLKSGKVWDLVPELTGGVFERFDLNFDADKIVFAWKSEHQKGYRIYEITIDPDTGSRKGPLRQLTFPQENEERLVEMYRATAHYHHGTDDMHPCYLPDGDICFISTRCQYGILCDGPDDFTGTVLYRMDPDGSNMVQLSRSSVSEASPSVMPDGRILYTRWEYYDKGAVSVKCLWAMRPDGSSSAEIYGNDISLPPTFLYGRPIPGSANKYVFLGTPHCPQNGVGTVIRLDTNRDIRSRDPMTYMTPYVDIQAEPGFAFKNRDDNWITDREGRGALFKDPYPLSEKLFLVSYKAPGKTWNDQAGYGLALLNEDGAVGDIYRDDEISCWLPYPLKARRRPPVLSTPIDEKLASQNLAKCVVTDVYHNMEDVERGMIRYLRVLEQIPRPWATRRRWDGDCYDQQHAVITKDTHLGLKVQHGVVPVEDDGSAHFLVPANANISLQALDKNYMAIQTERTFVNYLPGETRSCIGCHETPNDAATGRAAGVVKALQREASVPGPQPGEVSGRRAIDYYTDVQPVLDKHCVECHGGKKTEGDLDLRGTLTTLFCVSYEQLIPERRGGKGRPRSKYELVGPTIGENHPKTGNVHYMPARSFGSHASILVAMLAPEQVKLQNSDYVKIVEKLVKSHKDVKLSREELLKITNWVDTNSQYYGMYWGRKNIQYKDHPNFRPVPTFERASSMVSLIPEDER